MTEPSRDLLRELEAASRQRHAGADSHLDRPLRLMEVYGLRPKGMKALVDAGYWHVKSATQGNITQAGVAWLAKVSFESVSEAVTQECAYVCPRCGGGNEVVLRNPWAGSKCGDCNHPGPDPFPHIPRAQGPE